MKYPTIFHFQVLHTDSITLQYVKYSSWVLLEVKIHLHEESTLHPGMLWASLEGKQTRLVLCTSISCTSPVIVLTTDLQTVISTVPLCADTYYRPAWDNHWTPLLYICQLSHWNSTAVIYYDTCICTLWVYLHTKGMYALFSHYRFMVCIFHCRASAWLQWWDNKACFLLKWINVKLWINSCAGNLISALGEEQWGIGWNGNFSGMESLWVLQYQLDSINRELHFFMGLQLLHTRHSYYWFHNKHEGTII